MEPTLSPKISGASDNSFEAGGFKFKLGKLVPLMQFHITRRIGPLLSELLSVLRDIKASGVTISMSETEKFDQFSKLLSPLMVGLAKLSDSDSDYVLFRLLSAVEVFQPEYKKWTKIATLDGIVMENIDLPILLQVAGRSLMFNLSGFLASGALK